MPAAFTESRSREGDRMRGPDQEANKAVVRRFVEEFQNQNRVDAIEELVSRDFVNHSGTVRDVPGMERATDFEGMKRSTACGVRLSPSNASPFGKWRPTGTRYGHTRPSRQSMRESSWDRADWQDDRG
jgi:hypothetical protein